MTSREHSADDFFDYRALSDYYALDVVYELFNFIVHFTVLNC